MMVFSSSSSDSYGKPVDIWSFGMIAYEMVTLELPYASMKAHEAVTYIQKGERPSIPPSATGLPLPEDLPSYQPIVDVITRCAVFDPSARPLAAELCVMIEDKMREVR